MKLQKLTIHNIASIEDAVIDFEAEPLATSEVFLITGKTGAGKSTILDAICLALYADTPRLDGTKMQGDAPDGEKPVKIDDPRQLMRRNTGEAFVTLTFVGSNGVHYEATWSVARARNKATGNLKAKEWRLHNIDADYSLTRDKEIREEIYAAIGLDFKQFCRTTLLAQGEFTRFLNSKDDEKAEILEKITGVSIYTKVGAKVYELTNQKKRLWEDAQQLVSSTRTLTEEEIARKRADIEALEQQFREVKRRNDADKKVREWLRTDAELTLKVKEATEAKDKAAAVTASNDFKEAEAQVALWHSTIDVRACLSARNNSRQSAEAQKQRLQTLAATFADVLGGLSREEQKKAEAETELKAVDAFLETERERAGMYENAQTLMAALTTVDDGRKEIAKQQQAMDAENKTLAETLLPTLERSVKEADAAKLLFEQRQAALDTQETALAAVNLPALRQQHDTAKDLLQHIQTATEQFTALADAKDRVGKARTALSELQTAIEKDRTALELLVPKIHDAEVRMNTCKELLERQKDSIDKFAQAMRQKLHVGDTCPVCGQEIVHALPHEQELAELVGGLAASLREAETAYTNLVAEKNRLEAGIDAATRTWQHDKQNLERDNSIELASQKLLEACSACGLEAVGEHTHPALEELKDKTEQTLLQLRTKIEDGEQQETAIKAFRTLLEQARTEWNAKTTAVDQSRKAVEECHHRMTLARELAAAKQKDVTEAEATLAAGIAGQWPMDWHTDPTGFVHLLKVSADNYTCQQQRRQALASQLKDLDNTCRQVQEIVAKILALVADWRDIHAQTAAQLPNLIAAATDLHSDVASALTSLRQFMDSVTANQQQLDAFYAAHAEVTEEVLTALNALSTADITRRNETLELARRDLLTQTTLLQAAIKQQEEHRRRKPELSEGDTAEVLDARIGDSDRLMSEVNVRKGGLEQELRTDQENKTRLGALIADMENKQADYQRWSRMNSLLGDATGTKFRKIAQSYVLTSLIHSANGYMRTLTDRYTLRVSPGTFIILLEDAYQGYATRAASTISGGESFLVSLSLALALTDIGRQLAVDTLFIDEGFGTLSGEPLQNAVNTLRTLHAKSGRHVGIISHVEELQERIPVQIQVSQEGNSSSSKVQVSFS